MKSYDSDEDRARPTAASAVPAALADDPPRSYQCREPRCSKSFNRKSDLQRHTRIHTNERPYPCEWPLCTKSFIQRSALTVHNRTHTKEKPHKCDQLGCGKCFSDSSSLARHRRIHSGRRPYRCLEPDCDKSFCRKTTLTKHHERFHPVPSENEESDDNVSHSDTDDEDAKPAFDPLEAEARPLRSPPSEDADVTPDPSGPTGHPAGLPPTYGLGHGPFMSSSHYAPCPTDRPSTPTIYFSPPLSSGQMDPARVPFSGDPISYHHRQHQHPSDHLPAHPHPVTFFSPSAGSVLPVDARYPLPHPMPPYYGSTISIDRMTTMSNPVHHPQRSYESGHLIPVSSVEKESSVPTRSPLHDGHYHEPLLLPPSTTTYRSLSSLGPPYQAYQLNSHYDFMCIKPEEGSGYGLPASRDWNC